MVEQTLPQRWAAHWSAEPHRAVLLDEARVARSEGWLSAGELDGLTRRVAARLSASDVTAGERLLWVPRGDLPSVVVALAALRAGVVVVPVDARASAEELARVVDDVRPALVVAALTVDVPGAVVADDLVAQAGAGGPGAASGPAPELGPLDQVGAEDPALIVFTSGTTGSPKGAVISHGALAAGLDAIISAWEITAEDRIVLPLPLFHVHGLCAGLLGTLTAGGSVVVQARFDPGAVLEAVSSERASLFYGVPTMYHRLLAHGAHAVRGAHGTGRPGRGLAGLRLCVSGSAPLSSELWHQARRELGVALLERYGMTETLLTVSNPYHGERRPGTVGTALPGVQLRVLDDGALLVRGPSLFTGYWERPSATAEAFVDGWFSTGDIVSFDQAGYLVIQGRSSDLIITGGHNVHPVEVEDVLVVHPGVAEVAVVGLASVEWGEEVTAFVVGDVSLDELERLAAARLAPHKRPRRYVTVDALPRNSMGKVQRGVLRRR